jgi:hypothetical protein
MMHGQKNKLPSQLSPQMQLFQDISQLTSPVYSSSFPPPFVPSPTALSYQHQVVSDLRSSGVLRSIAVQLVTKVTWPLQKGRIDGPATSVSTTLSCVTPQTSKDIIYPAMEAWNYQVNC